MTEYDYSPEAYERHLATQQRIANWVDQTSREQSPSNPFVPLPGEHPSHSHSHSQPQPAFYATPQGVISPSYSSSRKHGHNHSPRSPPLLMSQGYTPVVSRSFSTPPTPVRNFYSLPSTPYPSYPTGSPYPYPTGSPYPAGSPSPYSSPYQPSPVSHPSYSQTSFHSPQSSFHSLPASHNPVIQQQSVANTYPYVQPSPQPVVLINRGSGSYVVVPAPGQQVQLITNQQQRPLYEPQDKGGSLFSKLKGLGTKSSKSSKYKRSRRDSY